MTIQAIPLNQIRTPKDYIRGLLDAKRHNHFLEILKDQGYIFPPIKVHTLAPPETAGSTEKPILYHFRIDDGVTRFTAYCAYASYLAARPDGPAAPLTIPAEVSPPRSDADAFDHQMILNADHGQPLTREMRDRYIKTAVETHKRTPAHVAQIVHLSVASVSRILAGKQSLDTTETSARRKEAATHRKPRKAKKTKKTKKGKKGPDVVAENQVIVAHFMATLKEVRDAVKVNRKVLTETITARDSFWTHGINPTIEALVTLRQDAVSAPKA